MRVKPGASRTRVGGRYGDDALVVAVSAPAVDGRANIAMLAALAAALGRPARDVQLVKGTTSRTKLIQVPDSCAEQIQVLLAD